MNVYDFDNTIYSGDSTFDFFVFSLKKHPAVFLCLFNTAFAATRYYIFKKGTKTEFKEKMYRFLRFTDTEKDVEAFWDRHYKNIKDFYINQQKTDDIIISASPEFLLSPVCKRLGIKNLTASRVDAVSGKYSGLNCHGQEKVKRFYKEYTNRNIDEFYSDSYSDTPLALLAKKSYIVKGNKISGWHFKN